MSSAKGQSSSVIVSIGDPKVLYAIRKTVLEMIHDSGFSIEPDILRTHPSLPPTVTRDAFESYVESVLEAKKQAHLLVGKRILEVRERMRKDKKALKDEIKKLEQTLSDDHKNNRLNSLQIASTKTQIKAKQAHMDGLYLSDLAAIDLEILIEPDLTLFSVRRPSLPFGNSLALRIPEPLIQQTHATKGQELYRRQQILTQSNAFDNPNIQPNDKMVVYFCNERKIGIHTFQMLVKTMKAQKARHGIFVSAEGCTPSISTSLIPYDPNLSIRIFTHEELQVNLIKYHQYVPRFIPLSSEEAMVYQSKYGKLTEVPRLFKSRPVARYYGFEIGQLVEVHYVGKVYPQIESMTARLKEQQATTGNSEQQKILDLMEDLIFPCKWRLVVEQ